MLPKLTCSYNFVLKLSRGFNSLKTPLLDSKLVSKVVTIKSLKLFSNVSKQNKFKLEIILPSEKKIANYLQQPMTNASFLFDKEGSNRSSI